MAAYEKFPCPECKSILEASGELDIDGRTFPVYQCESCLVMRDFCGDQVEVPITFYVEGGVAKHPDDA